MNRGFAVVPPEIVWSSGLSDGAFRLYIVLLAWRPEPDGWVIATYQQLGGACERSSDWAVDRVKELLNAGVLELRSGRRERVPNRYLLLLRQGRGVGLEVEAQPEPEVLNVGGMLDAEAADAAGVGSVAAAPGAAGGAAGLPHPAAAGVRRVEVNAASHGRHERTAVLGGDAR